MLLTLLLLLTFSPRTVESWQSGSNTLLPLARLHSNQQASQQQSVAAAASRSLLFQKGGETPSPARISKHGYRASGSGRPSLLWLETSTNGIGDDNDNEPHTQLSRRAKLRHRVSNIFRSSSNKHQDPLEASGALTQQQLDPQEIMEDLETENTLLRETVRQLELENDRLSSQRRLVLESFEGEGAYQQPKQQQQSNNNNNNNNFDADLMEFGITLTGEELAGDVNTYSPEETAQWCDELEGDEDSCPVEPQISFSAALRDRAYWLVGLLIMQSCSGLILSRNEALLANHPVIIYFLTMLVGAGGNAGNQASVRVIRGIALGTLNERTQAQFLNREFKMAAALSAILSLAGFLRAAAFRTPFPETVAVTASLSLIVFTSVCLGAVLPLMLQKIRVDPAHSSTTIQVIMDILGVLVAVAISGLILDSPMGMTIISRLGG